MSFNNIFYTTWPVGLFLLGTAALYHLLNKSRRDALVSALRDRKASTAQTPPRSLSPEKRPVSMSSSPSYTTVLPPSRRKEAAEFLPSIKEIGFPSEEHILKNILPMDQDYRTAPDHLYTPMGFSVGEVRALGDFPDYAALTDVPLPEPYKEFDIDQALPRPYRPFRWSYHQTMCMFRICQNQNRGSIN